MKATPKPNVLFDYCQIDGSIPNLAECAKWLAEECKRRYPDVTETHKADFHGDKLSVLPPGSTLVFVGGTIINITAEDFAEYFEPCEPK